MSTHSSINTSYRYTAPAVYTTCLYTALSIHPICTQLHQQWSVSTQLHQHILSVHSSTNNLSLHSSINASHPYTAPSIHPICTQLHQQPVSTQLHQCIPSLHTSINASHLYTAPSMHPICTQLHQYIPSVHSSINISHLYTVTVCMRDLFPALVPWKPAGRCDIPSVHSYCVHARSVLSAGTLEACG